MIITLLQPGKLGDLIICAPIAHFYAQQGYRVRWPVMSIYKSFMRCLPYVEPVYLESNLDTCLIEARQHIEGPVIDLGFSLPGQSEVNAEYWKSFRQKNDKSFIALKYSIALVPLDDRWKFSWERDKQREQELYNIVVEEFGKDYTLIQDNRAEKGSEPNPHEFYIEINAPAGVNAVYLRPVRDFGIQDWYKVIKEAREVHCIDSSLANFIEVIPEFKDLKKYYYDVRRPESIKYTRSIIDRNNWILAGKR